MSSKSIHERAAAAIRELTSLQREALAECGVSGRSTDDTPFSLLWEQGMSAEELAEEALQRAAEYASEQHVLRTGRVYCYGCRTANCEHSSPSAPGEVFVGYGATGCPQWQEFFNFLLAQNDERTDLLFRDSPHLLSRFVSRRQLTAEQLTSFGKNSLTYRIWGQITAGYLKIGDVRAGLTLQLVETRDHALHFQVIMPENVQEALAEAPSNKQSALHRVHDAIATARLEILAVSSVWQTARRREMQEPLRKQAFATLRHLGHSIERKGRQQHRRTHHAEVRGRQNRPVHKAREELTLAASANFYRDAARNSVVVMGKGGRLHVFSEQGKHITSLILGGDELEKRQRRNRYQQLPPEAAENFRRTALNRLRDDLDA